MGKKSKTPKTPDFEGLAYQQAALDNAASKDTTAANRPDQYNALGSVTWGQDENGNWTQSAQYNPMMQGLFNQQVGNAGQAGQVYSNMLNMLPGQFAGMNNTLGMMSQNSGAASLPNAPRRTQEYDQRVIDTVRSLQAPELARSRQAQEARLAAMGLGTGSGEAYNTQQNLIGQNENDADLKAILSGMDQANTRYGQDLNRYGTEMQGALGSQGLSNQYQLGVLNNQMGLLGAQASMLNSLYGQQSPELTGQLGMTGFTPATSMSSPDVMGAAQQSYNAAVNNANVKNADKANNMNAAGSIIGAGMMAAGIF